MKSVSRAICFCVLFILLIACNQSIDIATPTLPLKPTLTLSPTLHPTATATITLTPYRAPTIIPTIEPERVPDLLKNSLLLEPLGPVNGHNLQRITGWSNGFTGNMWDRGSRGGKQGYLWMDAGHLLLFPATGETLSPNWSNITTRPVVMNLATGKIWLPPVDRAMNNGRWFNIILPRWSPELQILVTGENVEQEEGTSTYTVDGELISHYTGQLVDISPSANRVFINGDTWIDLASGKKVDFGWGPGSGYEVDRWLPIWSRDENQIYFCCYYYGNAKTGQSYTILTKDTTLNGNPFTNPSGLDHAFGVWLNDNNVMAIYDAWWYGSPGFTAIFDVSKKTFYNLGIVAGLPDAFNSSYSHYSISPNGDYMYVSQGAQSLTDPQVYLVDLKTLKSELYHVLWFEWSANGKYALTDSQVLNLTDKTLRTLPNQPYLQKHLYWIASGWHPTEGARISIYADNQQQLVVSLLDIDALTYRKQELELPSNFNGTYYTNAMNIVWNPKGDQFVLAAADGSLWLMHYPKLEKLEQITSPMADVKDMSWSPDGRYLAYIGGSDIYIVDVGSNP